MTFLCIFRHRFPNYIWWAKKWYYNKKLFYPCLEIGNIYSKLHPPTPHPSPIDVNSRIAPVCKGDVSRTRSIPVRFFIRFLNGLSRGNSTRLDSYNRTPTLTLPVYYTDFSSGTKQLYQFRTRVCSTVAPPPPTSYNML